MSFWGEPAVQAGPYGRPARPGIFDRVLAGLNVAMNVGDFYQNWKSKNQSMESQKAQGIVNKVGLQRSLTPEGQSMEVPEGLRKDISGLGLTAPETIAPPTPSIEQLLARQMASGDPDKFQKTLGIYQQIKHPGVAATADYHNKIIDLKKEELGKKETPQQKQQRSIELENIRQGNRVGLAQTHEGMIRSRPTTILDPEIPDIPVGSVTGSSKFAPRDRDSQPTTRVTTTANREGRPPKVSTSVTYKGNPPSGGANVNQGFEIPGVGRLRELPKEGKGFEASTGHKIYNRNGKIEVYDKNNQQINSFDIPQ